MIPNYKKHTFRKQVLFYIYLILSVIILNRFFFLQIVENEKYKIKAGNNSLRKIIIYPPRGIIYDRNFIPLVDNKPLYEINIIPADMQNSFDYKLINTHLNVTKNKIDSLIAQSKNVAGGQFKPILLKRYINFNTKAILEEYKLDLKGLYFSELPARIYTTDCKLSHVLGYLRKIDQKKLISNDYYLNDIIGFSGVEKFYENKLRGIYGTNYFLVDRFGIIQGKYETDNDLSAIQGSNLNLTIDSRIQSFAENIFHNYKGSIIIMNPDNGEIISLISSPAYDLDSFVGPIPIDKWNELVHDENKPFTNRATQATYPPGSIFKLVLAAIALEKDIVSTNWEVECNGKYHFYDTIFRCWKTDGHGNVNLNDAIKKSCNIYFYNLMQKVDFDTWYSETKKFGFGELTGIDLPQENKGRVPNKEFMNQFYKELGGWSKGHLLNLSIGQGEVSVTPMQILQLVNLIATNGKTFIPHLNLNSDKQYFELDYNNNVWKILNIAMYEAVNGYEGTAYNASIKKKYGVVFGKTGTAQVCSNCSLEPHGWFTGYLKMNNSLKYSICIIVENGGKGSNVPSKMAKKIFEYIINLNNV